MLVSGFFSYSLTMTEEREIFSIRILDDQTGQQAFSFIGDVYIIICFV